MESDTSFILLCVPEPLQSADLLRSHEQEVIAVLKNPPRSRRSGWFLRPQGESRPSRTGLGISRKDSFSGIEVTVAWNGSVVFQVALETSGGTWGLDPIDGVPVVNPLAIIEPTVLVFALMKHLSQYFDNATSVQVRAAMRNAKRMMLTPFRADSYAIKLKHFDRFPDIIKRASQEEVSIHPQTISLTDLDDSHARDVVVELFAEAGFEKSKIELPYFDDAGNFTLK